MLHPISCVIYERAVSVTPAKAGVQSYVVEKALDSGLRQASAGMTIEFGLSSSLRDVIPGEFSVLSSVKHCYEKFPREAAKGWLFSWFQGVPTGT